MNTQLPYAAQANTVTDVYTNLQGLQGLKTEANKDEAIKKIAQQFESMFVSLLMKNMRSANEVFESGNMFQSEEGKFYRDLLDQQLSLTMSHGRGIGIADVLYRQLSSRASADVSDNMSPHGSIGLPALKASQSISRHIPETSNTIRSSSAELPASATPTDAPAFSSPAEFVARVYPHAKRAAAKIGVAPELLIAQSALETGWGKYLLSDDTGRSSMNFFNIKAGSGWDGDAVSKTVVEYANGHLEKEHSNFRKYKDVAASFDDYANFVTNNPRYKNAVEVASNSEQYIAELTKSGYATDPKYTEKVLDIKSRLNVSTSALLTRADDPNRGA